MFQFSRPTLWIILNVSLLLVIVLNFLGPNPEDIAAGQTGEVVDAGPTITSWAMNPLQARCELQQCSLELPSANLVRVSFVAEQRPTQQPLVPVDLPLSVDLQGGHFVVSSTVTAQTNIDNAIAFFQNWLPAQGQVKAAFSGSVDAQWAKPLLAHSFEFAGESEPLVIEPASGLGRLVSPAFGGNEQLSFLMWVEILRMRLAGYNTTARWDHRGAPSAVLFNSTLSADVFYPVTETELAPVLEAYVQSANQAVRSGEQIHRYLQTAVVYDLPFHFFTEQTERLNKVSLDSVNRIREKTLEQITQR